jgi:hypothetical protein
MKRTARQFITTLWQGDATLTAAGMAMLVTLAAAIVGLAVDPRVITGLPAWMKPAKFAASTAIFMLTMAWIFAYLPSYPRMRRIAGRGTAAILILEVAIIFIQAWRGRTSHFNVATPLDAVLFSIMGSGIAIQTGLSVAVAVALWRERFTDQALGWALRLGLAISILGASIGGFMVNPTKAQLAEAKATHHLPVAGAHTVGATDGGPGLPALGWSRTHGDLRVPHFAGLHALQIIPLLVIALKRRNVSDASRVRLAFVVAASYFSLCVILLWQALRAQSVVNPDMLTVAAFTVWAMASGVAVWASAKRTKVIQSRAIVFGGEV